MKNRTLLPYSRNIRTYTIAGLLLNVASLSLADSSSDFLSALQENSVVSLNARARYEYNEIGANEINGYSLRTRLGLTTGDGENLKFMIEMEDLSFANDDDRPGLDVPTTELNQIWASYKDVTFGRQIYTLDDHRFIGHVGWRQNIQTYDAITSSFLPDGNSKIYLSYLDAVHRVNATSQDLSGILVNGDYEFSKAFSLTGFGYLLDFDQPVLASSDTFGVRGVGKLQSNEVIYNYSFSYAIQQDNSGSLSDFDVSYLAGELGAAFGGVSLTAGVEILEGDGVTGFSTPLATVHKFNGFADSFAGNSLGLGGGLPQGLEDYYVVFGFKAGDVPIKLIYHQFDAETTSVSLGSEIDLVASYKLNDYVTFVTKFADYNSDEESTIAYGALDKTVFTMEANLKF